MRARGLRADSAVASLGVHCGGRHHGSDADEANTARARGRRRRGRPRRPAGPGPRPGDARKGGTPTLGRNHDADRLYPGRSTGLSAIATNLLLYDGLVLHDFQMKIRPALAERWEVSGDGLTWTFHLRKSVRFHCGAPFTAHDVKDHLDRWIDAKEAFPTRAKVASLEETRAVNDQTVVVRLKNPTLVFLNNISQTEWAYASIPHAKHVGQYGKEPERVKAFQGIEQRLVGEAVVVPVQHIRWIFGSRARVRGMKYHPIHGVYKLMDTWVG
jgi:ABC-type transport system substrate-binding protein